MLKRCKEEAKKHTKEEDEKLEEMAKHTRLWEDWSDFDPLDTVMPLPKSTSCCSGYMEKFVASYFYHIINLSILEPCKKNTS